MKESWSSVEGFEGIYEVSTFGKVRSLDRLVFEKSGKRKFILGRILVPKVQKNGYLLVKLSKNGGINLRYVHELVLTTFVGPRPKKCQARHFPDNDKSNCRASNLKWRTPKQNQADRKLVGNDHKSVAPRGKLHYKFKQRKAMGL